MDTNYKPVSQWKLEINNNVSIEDFNNVSDPNLCTYPGKLGDGAYTRIFEDAVKLQSVQIGDDYLYSFKGKTYFYAIKKDNTELIAKLCKDGKIIPVLSGAGKFSFVSLKDQELYRFTSLKSFKVLNNGITVEYETVGQYTKSEKASVTYTFYDECISVEAAAKCDTNGVVSSEKKSGFVREFLTKPAVSKNRVAMRWVYPENGDFAYKAYDALSISDEIDDFVMYTFVRDKQGNGRYIMNSCQSESLPLNVQPRGAVIDYVDYVYNYDLVFVDKTEQNESYKALFKGRKMNYAAGVCTVEKGDNTTYFIGNDILLNVNVTNISDNVLNYAVRYNIIDSYNTVVSEGVFYNNQLKAEQSANRNIAFHGEKYGMYYLNLYVTDGKDEYRECYPFALLENYEFKHRDTTPFGIDAMHIDTFDEAESAASILNKMGVGLVRYGRSPDNEHLADICEKHGINRHVKILAACNKSKDKIDDLLGRVKKNCAKWMERAELVLLANEPDTKLKGDYELCKEAMETWFYPYTHKPVYDYIDKNYPQHKRKVSWTGTCHANLEWLECLYEQGIWQTCDFIDTHSYCYPKGPDKIFHDQMATMYAAEYVVSRWRRACRRFGDKPLVIGETGYTSPPLNPNGVDNTMMADFNTRLGIFWLDAGAKIILYYCLFDRTSAYTGGGTWNEMYFGSCYDYDYFGVYMPKPWAAAYANMLRRLDGVTSCKRSEKYDEDKRGTLRLFHLNTEESGDFCVAWSNIYLPPNTTAKGQNAATPRVPKLSWENHWPKSEKRLFDANAETVKVVDTMGNARYYKAQNGKVEIELTGSPVYIYGIY